MREARGGFFCCRTLKEDSEERPSGCNGVKMEKKEKKIRNGLTNGVY